MEQKAHGLIILKGLKKTKEELRSKYSTSPAKIRSRHLSITSQKHYSLNQLLGFSFGGPLLGSSFGVLFWGPLLGVLFWGSSFGVPLLGSPFGVLFCGPLSY